MKAVKAKFVLLFFNPADECGKAFVRVGDNLAAYRGSAQRYGVMFDFGNVDAECRWSIGYCVHDLFIARADLERAETQPDTDSGLRLGLRYRPAFDEQNRP